MAAWVDHTEATIPPPTPVLIRSMAKEAFSSVVESGLISPCEWRHLDDYNQEAFTNLAKRCYGVVALHGGAKLREIK